MFLYKVCQKDGILDGGELAKKHTQDEWEELKENKLLVKEWQKICPSSKEILKNMKHKDKKNLYDFVWRYASDGEIPSCSGF